jgi:hypothetical protein
MSERNNTHPRPRASKVDSGCPSKLDPDINSDDASSHTHGSYEGPATRTLSLSGRVVQRGFIQFSKKSFE